jgi:energy-coupling factor transporter transmembrane protein EcfT
MEFDGSVRIDARIGTAIFAAIVATALFVLSSPGAMILLLAYVLCLLAAVGGGLRPVGRQLPRLAPIVALIVVLNGAAVAGDGGLTVGGRVLLSKQGLSAGAFFSVRFLVLYFAAAAFVAVTSPVEIATGVYGFLRPVSVKLANRAAFYGFVVTSFLPLFSEEFERVRLAQSFRGGDFRGGFTSRVAAVRLLVVPLVLSAIHRSSQLAAVVELRGLRDRVGTALPAARPGLVDAVAAAVTAAVIAIAVLLLENGAV